MSNGGQKMLPMHIALKTGVHLTNKLNSICYFSSPNGLVSTNVTIILKKTQQGLSFFGTCFDFKHHHQPLWIYSKDLQNGRYTCF